MRFFKPLLCAFLISFGLNTALAQLNNIRFDRITINDGLSLSSVYVIYQDSKGFMWFGTEDGLNKYDGKNFRIFRPETGNRNSIGYRWPELIFEDSNGQLWFGSKGGLTRFNPITEQFIRYNAEGIHRLVGDTITCLYENSSKQLWIGTLGGMNMIDLDNNSVALAALKGMQIKTIKEIDGQVWVGTNRGLFRKIGATDFQKVTIPHPTNDSLLVFSIISDKKDNIWVGAGDCLFRTEFIHDSDSVEWTNLSEKSNLEMSQIEHLIFDDNENLWVASFSGLYKFNHKDQRLSQVIKSIDLSHSLAINPKKPIHLDSSGYIWYGTHGEGIYRINSHTDQFTNFRNNTGDLSSLSENTINCIFEDGDENIWIGTFGAGISIYRPDAHKFGFMCHQPFKANSLSSNFVWSIMECADKRIWIGTDDAGLNLYNPVTGRFQNFVYDAANPYSISHSSVRKVYQDSQSRIWIGTDGGGLNRFYPETQRFESFQNEFGNSGSISGNSVRVIYEDNDHRIWIGTRSGLNLFNPETSTFQRFVHDENDPSSISNNFVYSSIYQDSRGFLWIGTYGGGLNKLDIETGKFESYIHEPGIEESISDNIVFSIHEEREGILWIGTNSGLNRFDMDSKSFEHFGIEQGLPNEVIYGVLPDDQNNLWLSTNKGICRFSLDDYSVKNFSINDGLQSNEFNGGAFHKGKSGQMYFGGVYGLNIIDPEYAYMDVNKSKVVITSFEILGNKVLVHADSLMPSISNQITKRGDQYYFSKNISYAKELRLDYHHRFFSIEYAALNSDFSNNLNFQYIMEGLDQEWNDAGNRNFVSFANMQPGEYIFKVRSVNIDGFEGLSEANLRIVIAPPFWKTWWFYLLEFILIFVILVFAYKYLLKIRTNKLLRIQNEKIYLANQKLTESEKNLKRLNATKDKFFSIISHDLKNPFTSLLSISELMATDYKEMDEEEREQGIKRVYESGNRIYKLLDNLLTWSRAQSGKIIFRPVQLDLVEVVRENLSLLMDAAINKNISVSPVVPKSAIAYCDMDMLNTVIRNLLNNAIKFSSEGGCVEVTIKDIKTLWEISVADNGIGIAEEHHDKLFRIEAKYKSEGTAGEKGTGLGLIICKEFVEKNGGDIYVKSKEGEGSVFTFSLPKSGGFVE